MDTQLIHRPGAQRLGLRAALLPLAQGSLAAVNVSKFCKAESLSPGRSRQSGKDIPWTSRQLGWLARAAAGLPQSWGFALVLCWLSPLVAHAGPRTSSSYTVATDTTDAGGQRTSSAAYRNDGSLTEVADISTSTSATAKPGFVGQLTDATALQLTAAPTTVNEGSTRQLSASLLNDDLTTTALLSTDVSWSVQSGPLTSISTSGLATAGTVYQNTSAAISGLHSTLTSTLNLTVLNTNTDDLPGYSGDGLDDAWQAQYFGLNNPLAAPNAITDGTGLTNLFKFTAGLIPNNNASTFLFNPQPVPATAGQMQLVIHPRLNDRTYTIQTSPTLGPSAVWTPLTTFTLIDNGLTRTMTDTAATGAQKFYRVEISKP